MINHQCSELEGNLWLQSTAFIVTCRRAPAEKTTGVHGNTRDELSHRPFVDRRLTHFPPGW